MEKVLEIHNITKKYGDLTAVDDVSLDIYEGDLIGLLGHNGAGKTTLFVMLAGLTMQTSGNIKVCGKNIEKNMMDLKKNISFLPDNTLYYENLTAKQNLEYFSELADADKSKVPELLEIVGMSKWADKKVGEFSKGMTQRIGFAQALVKDPKVIFLDEPTSGLDPKARIEMNLLLKKLNEKGIAIVISSHVLSEIKDICSKIAIMKQGKLVAYNTLENLCKQEKSNSILLETKDIERTASILKTIKNISFFQQDNVFKIISETDIREYLLSILNESHVPVLTLEYEKEDLYDIFEKYYQVA
ncbi:ABC transporter ATP-binding protein [Methanosarcina sp.]|uniref:ABC transporter ATP-binding protein n=1 Tax=Methanosarcina sp. TaxID=2213 RepID=UPI0029880B50|nr:ABC transporter ATP-binding protein [Methanosarcina sp.]MDW5549021.1 ABC transporter ATP-binding protein [Methanosarcina sp.]MDW5552724.1 ABC transporter ATP-binding protein [Methanosarcina sp.]MDW5559280.1 ABC transporter ATP-binding protein [Methanosarcina sp.]